MRRPLRSWKNLLGMLGLQVVERASAPRPAKRQRSFESLEDRSMMATLYWDTNGTTPGLGGAGTWDLSAANWTSDPTGSSATQAWNNAAGDDAVFSGAGAAVTLGSGIQAASLKIEANGFTLGSGSLAVNVTGEVNVATGISTTISTQLTGSTELRKTGTGTVTLSGNNTLSGGSKLEAGTVTVNHNSALGSGTITLAGGKLQAGAAARTLANNIVAATGTTSELVSPTNYNLTLNGNLSGTGTIWKTGAYSVYLGGDNSAFAGTLSHRQSNFYFNAATAASALAAWDVTGGNQFALNFSGDATVQFGSLSGTSGALSGGGNKSGNKIVEIGALNSSTNFAGTIADYQTTSGGSTVSVVKKGTGTLTLSGSNTFTAGTSLVSGTLIVTHNNALGSGTITLAGGKLQSGGSARTLSNPLVATTGTTSELVSPTNYNLTLNGNITGDGTILKSGAYSVYLGGDNSAYSGAFSNRQSNVFLNSANSGSALAAWDITGGDLLAMNFTGDGTVQLGSLAGTTGRIISGIANGIKTLEVGALNQAASYAGTIQNHTTTTTATVVNLVKKGSGSLTLSGANTFTGDLTIESGSLTLANNTNNGISDAGKGIITLGSGAVLAVSGSNVFGTGANLPADITLGVGSHLDLTGNFYAQLPHVTLNGAAITSGAGNATYGSWAFMGGISAAGSETSSITGQNMFISGAVAIDVATGATLEVTSTFEKTSGYGESTLNRTGGGRLIRYGNLIVNGSFEQPDVSSGTYSLLTSIPGWSLLSGDRFEIQDNISGLGGASDGAQHLELDSNNTSSDVQQTVAVVAGAVYSVSFDYRGRPNRTTDDNKLKFQLYDSFDELIYEESIIASNTSAWTTKTFEFQAPTNAVRLAFLDTGTNNSYGAYIDNVKLDMIDLINIDIYDGQNGILVSEQEEDTVGAYTLANLNDTDADGTSDYTDNYVGVPTGANSTPIPSTGIDITRTILSFPDVTVFRVGDKIRIRPDSINIQNNIIVNQYISMTITAIDYDNKTVTLSAAVPDAYKGNAEVQSTGRNEVDLMKITISKPKIMRDTDVIDLTVPSNIKVWINPYKEVEYVSSNGVIHLPKDFVDSFQGDKITLWLEAVSVSQSIHDIDVSVAYRGAEDKVKATAMWSTMVSAKYDNESPQQVFTGANWEDVPTQNVAFKNFVEFYTGTGLLARSNNAGAAANGIALQYKVLPYSSTGYPARVTVDIARVADGASWKRTLVNGQYTDWSQMDFRTPVALAEQPNDDSRNVDESPLLAGGFIYSYDAPGIPVGLGQQNDQIQQKTNFSEFARITFDGTRAEGNLLFGSRASDFFYWRSQAYVHYDTITSLMARYTESGFNIIDNGHFGSSKPTPDSID